MPELPEVETIVRALRDGGRGHGSLLGKTVEKVQVLWPGAISTPQASAFVELMAGRRFEGVTRRGKFLCFQLDEGTMLVHLRMSGDLRIDASDGEVLPHDRVIWELSGEEKLVFNDPRKFGRVWLTESPETVLGGLGPDPYDQALSASRFWEMLQGLNRQIKPLLMDQGFLAGVGNIYSDEALFLARIHPLRVSRSLSEGEAGALLDALRQVLDEAIQRSGSSIDWMYRGGDFQNYFRVYQRTGDGCPTCGNPIERKVIGQRSTHFCPVCQQLHGRDEPGSGA